MPKDFLTEDEKKRIKQAIADAELATSGEIRLHLEQRCTEDVLDRAAYIFEKLEMHKTELRNGVLFYLSIEDHKLAILGDAGINAKTGNGFWSEIKDHLISAFKAGNYADGLCEGIAMAGEKLKVHFPYKKNDQNELSNEISYGKSDKNN